QLRSSNASGLPSRNSARFLGIRASFQRDNLPRHFGVRVLSRQPSSPVSVGYVPLGLNSIKNVVSWPASCQRPLGTHHIFWRAVSHSNVSQLRQSCLGRRLAP